MEAVTEVCCELGRQALARSRAVRGEKATVMSAVSAAQMQMAAGRFQGAIVTGNSCLPAPAADLLRIAC